MTMRSVAGPEATATSNAQVSRYHEFFAAPNSMRQPDVIGTVNLEKPPPRHHRLSLDAARSVARSTR